MSTLTVTLPTGSTVCNGKQVTFRAPCDCTGVTGIIIGSTTYALVGADNDALPSGSFSNGSMVSVILDTDNNRAYIENANTSALLSTKANVAANPTAGHLAALDASGNPVDSGKTADTLETLWVNITTYTDPDTGLTEYKTDSSPSAIYTAFLAGRNILAICGSYICSLHMATSSHSFFKLAMEDWITTYVVSSLQADGGGYKTSVVDHTFVDIGGGTMTGALTLSGDPTADLHAATKKYVDDSISASITAAIGGSY